MLYTPLRIHRNISPVIRQFVRFKSVKPTYDDLESYLKYANFVQLSKNSTVFAGTTFEMKAKEKLENALKIPALTYSGGAYDNGIDLLGNFDLEQFKEENEPRSFVPVNGKRVKPLILRKRTDIDVLVQCKSFSKKIAAKEIRELSGIFNFNINQKDRNNTLVIMTAPSLLTPQGQSQIDKVDIPMIYCQLTRMKQVGADEYDIKSYEDGDIVSFYFNPYSIALFEGTSFQKHAISQLDL